MIRFIKGILAMTRENEVVIDHHGMGYAISVPMSVIENLPAIGQEVMLYTYLNVREDAMQLFGFLTPEDLNIYKLLITVNGVGPKAGLGIMGVLSEYEIRCAVIAGDAKSISRAPGIGPKTAEKIILELKDKIAAEEMFEEFVTEKPVTSSDSGKENLKGVVQDAVEALVVLGYPKMDAVRAVQMVEMSENMTVEELLKQSLKNL